MKTFRFLIIIVFTTLGFEMVRQHFTEFKEDVLPRALIFFAIAASVGIYTVIINKKGPR